MQVINLKEKFNQMPDYWHPRIIGEVNDSFAKIGKLKGEFVWHSHENEDELFLVVQGHLVIKLRDGDLHLDPGELVIIPKGVEHCPVAEEEVHVLLLEPKTTLNTGNVNNQLTVTHDDWI